ncbi:MAG: redox-regulated ATPase YchF [Candidatus Aenigmarchaeota archaeon]|nr:redox-regulated ATPase YchF [Candidatus Aenigmarchaeota archaeon]
MLIGVVGKPSSGKSTFFKAATLVDVAIAPYPFTTIKPNFGTSFVRVKCIEDEFHTKCNPRKGYCEKGIRYVPVEMIDVAGLVPGAHEGKGLGNQFLNDLNMADVLIHIVDISGSANEKGEIIGAGKHDPAKDVRFLEYEIDMWYLGILKKGWDKFARKIKQNPTKIEDEIANQMSSFGVKPIMVEEALSDLKISKADPTLWTPEQLKELTTYLRKRTKPLVIACNKIDIPDSHENFERLKKEFPDYFFTPCSAESELALREAAKKGLIKYHPGDSDFEIPDKNKLSEKQVAALEFIKENVLKKYGSTGIQMTLDAAVFNFLKYIAIFPGGVNKLCDKDGNVLPDCFLMPPSSTALDFANKIHTDLGKGFLYAIDVRTKMKIKGEHKLKNRDVIEIVSSAK